jgi:hypothetical protein
MTLLRIKNRISRLTARRSAFPAAGHQRRRDGAQLDAAISQADAQTTAGLIKFSQSTHTAVTPCYVTQWQNGKLAQVQPPAPGVTFEVPTAGLG